MKTVVEMVSIKADLSEKLKVDKKAVEMACVWVAQRVVGKADEWADWMVVLTVASRAEMMVLTMVARKDRW